MGTARRARAARAEGGEGGFTLVELLVAISVFAVLTVLVFSGLSKTAQTVNDVRSITNLTEEARVATERITRELRQAGCRKPCTGPGTTPERTSAIQDAHLPAPGGTDDTSVTLGVDFNGDQVLDENAVDPEIITYRFDPGSGELTLTANDPSGTSVTRPILAKNVTAFVLTFSSSLWEYDTAPRNGVTDWTEIDASAIGNDDDTFNDGEFDKIDSVGITIQLQEGTRTQTYTTQVDLRNQNQN